MINTLTATRQALITQVQGITTASGYLTNIGQTVRTGWLNEVLKQEKLPRELALIQRAPGRPSEKKAGGLKAFPGFFVIGLVAVSWEGWEDAVDAMELDILQALLPPPEGTFSKAYPKGVTTWSLGASEPFPPGNGQTHAGVLIPIHFTTIIQERIRR
ncbi:hypothetical protein [Pseudomonas sp. zfem005]|uniref:hypothetical protein n=1 Tax=Pseudomonas sp. zfem005 TaxID=3078200 RepID=UPI0029277A98|nr:hypothetical protein [Pseudomonas sp. zfem005]MDU9415568.1 hypothetical protein [Pseudomonas sp. zfem005]